MDTNWTKILEILKKTTNPGLFQVWLKPLEPSWDGTNLCLNAPNEFVASSVRNRFYDALSGAAKQVLGLPAEIKIGVAPPKAGATENALALLPERGPIHGPSAELLERGQLLLPVEGATFGGGRRNWRFSFEDFVVGPCNEFAYASAKAVAKAHLGANRLFISSSSGLGKTHLLHALGNQICRDASRDVVRIEYLSAEQFACQLVAAIKTRSVDQFKSRLREHVDLLLLEDIHFLQGKPKIQEELLATLNALQDRGSRIVMTSCFLPRELKEVDSHLISRLCSGPMAVIEAPDFETRRQILHYKAKATNVFLPESVAELVADRITTDVRMLESCLTNMILKAKLLNRSIGLDLAMEVVSDYTRLEEKDVTIEHIIKFICDCYDLKQAQLGSKSRGRHLVQARNALFYLARKHTALSLKGIGERFNRKHSTVLKGIASIEREIALETPLGRQLSKTIELFGRHL